MIDRYTIVLISICALLVLVIFSIDLQLPLGVAGGVPYVVVILAALWSKKASFAVYLAIICSVMTLLGFYFSPEGGEPWKVTFNRSLALFAIWITAILSLQWKLHEQEISSFNQKIKEEKERIYLATIHGAQHVINNLLNQLLLVELEIENHPEFDKNVSSMFGEMLVEADTLMKELSHVDNIDDETIRQSVSPKQKAQ
jgi:hypothetical protein